MNAEGKNIERQAERMNGGGMLMTRGGLCAA